MSKTRSKRFFAWGYVLGCALAVLASQGVVQSVIAQGSKLELSADSIEYDMDSGGSIYRGNVVIKQGDMEVHGDVIKIDTKDGALSSLKVLEGEGLIRWRTASGEMLEGRGNNIDYDVSKQVFRLSGGAEITRRGQRVTGEAIFYDARRQVLRIEGGKKRARMVVETDQPSRKPPREPERPRRRQR